MKSFDFPVKIRLFTVPGRLFSLLLILLFTCQAGAVEVQGLYQGTVGVESRDNERERNRAFSDALRQVLIKVTGHTDIFSQPQIRRALNNADDYVDTWSYQTMSNTDPDAIPASLVELRVTFFEPEVLSLLDNASIPLWPGNRPYTLVWVVVQDELGERQLLGSSSTDFPGIRSVMEKEASERAMPLLLPILDFEDRRLVSADDVWDFDVDKLLQASRRYQSESVLAIRLFRSLDGEIIGKSSYLFRDRVLDQESIESSVEPFVRESINLAANELSSYYAVLLSGTNSNIEINLTVEGIKSAEDYAGLLAYVGGLTDVNNYQIASVDNSTIELRLFTGGQLRQLVEAIALDRNLEPLGDLVRDDNQVYMSYLWNSQ